jgi:hypothetical protein
VLRIERHRLGLRAYVWGRRVHEWHLGVVVLACAALLGAAQIVGLVPVVGIAVVGCWLVAKDWRDLTGRGRDTAAWRLGLHRRPTPLRPFRQLDDAPGLAAVLIPRAERKP